MAIEFGTIEGNFSVEGEFTLYGVVTGDITVRQNSTLILFGLCGGNLIVKAGGTAKVDGKVCHNINNDGHLTLRGMVQGSVFTQNGQLERTPEAVVFGEIVQ